MMKAFGSAMISSEEGGIIEQAIKWFKESVDDLENIIGTKDFVLTAKEDNAMNSCFIFPLKIHWLMLFDKFLTGAMLGLGFIVAIWTVIKLTQKPKKERKPHRI
ncbi:hypothetical protein DKE39_019565 (plasmid) [Acinetobacter baumannii]|nr:hypothetical protein DKE39_019565 [Acinetobacter baumannii]